ncbi:class II fructose-bisphosphatase [Aureimonas jatrophae]|uniref:Fructose-1,6-bisphosphatase n=1 Tax=Aureimonas jatrophae TaxID=1166073 RepID=A0A1H0JKM5_9HYPH|nr:class II fructose-bisphosphatase [Aureimonas jatrophae]MBB3951351.1 fructose-1,6-bisphosphatase II / sedoheptulose-1,7-bisphosphatase [Aureimonas jatrophae]SDO44337.1 fructose-1,6-bisphosphatase II / sedoheptulose-1,7-bisphosphatase [Aureimonas jatrophae]
MNTQVEEIDEAASLERVLSIEIARVTERAAVAAATFRGRGDERAADGAAIAAMREELDTLAVSGTVVIGEGEADDAPSLYLGEELGSGGPRVDIALDPLEGTTICAKNLPNAISVVAVATRGALLTTPDVYMDKIAVGPGYPDGIVGLDRSPRDNIEALARAKGVRVQEITACILDRPRHARLIEEVRQAGAAIRLIGDGDVAGVIHTTDPAVTGIDIYLGIGGAPEGVLAAAALRCRGGQIEGRLQLNTMDRRIRAEKLGLTDPDRLFRLDDMVMGDVIFAATGVTGGTFLEGVRFQADRIETHTVVMRSRTRTVRDIRARHYDREKFGL